MITTQRIWLDYCQVWAYTESHNILIEEWQHCGGLRGHLFQPFVPKGNNRHSSTSMVGKSALSANPPGHQWLIPITLATQEAEIRRIRVRSQLEQTVQENLSWNNTQHKIELAKWLKYSACLASMRPGVQTPVPTKNINKTSVDLR
jgi:hypothetical protein